MRPNKYWSRVCGSVNGLASQTRQVLDSTFLEASLENATKGQLLLEYVRFDPAPGVQVEPVDVRDALAKSTAADGPLGYVKRPLSGGLVLSVRCCFTRECYVLAFS